MITALDVRMAEHIIDASGVVEILLCGRNRSNRGRKTDPVPYRLLLIGGLLNVMTRGNFVIKDVHHTLTEGLSLDDQFRLGVRRHIETRSGTTVKVLRLDDLYNIVEALDSYLAYGSGSAPDISDDERVRRHGVIQSFCDELMDVFDLGFNSRTYAMDATGIWSWGKGNYRSTTPNSDDPDEPAGEDSAEDSASPD
jgi:hypothetical protein